MKPLNEKQQKVLSFLQERAQDGLPPTVREICAAAGIKSTSTVHAYLKTLEENGYISRQSGLNRAIRLPGESVARVPLLGKVTAGQPILAVENIEGYLPWDGDERCFALRVRGDSMIGAGILSGDKVVVRPQSTAENGQIVVALLDDSATVKRFRREKGKVWLLPENPAYDPIDGTDCSIIGLVKAVYREY